MAPTHHDQGPTLRWSAVVAGAVIGVALMALLTSLFVALGTETGAIDRNLHWFGFGSVLVALLVAGLLAGGLSRNRGAGTGLLHGLTAWGLILVVALAFPFPQAFGLLEMFATPVSELPTGPLWAGFLSLLGGALAAAIGGLIGGMATRPVAPEAEYEAGQDHEAGREFEAGRAYEAERLAEAGRRFNGGRSYEGEPGRTETADWQDAPTERQPAAAGGDEPARGRRRR